MARRRMEDLGRSGILVLVLLCNLTKVGRDHTYRQTTLNNNNKRQTTKSCEVFFATFITFSFHDFSEMRWKERDKALQQNPACLWTWEPLQVSVELWLHLTYLDLFMALSVYVWRIKKLLGVGICRVINKPDVSGLRYFCLDVMFSLEHKWI